ncbi:MAG: lipoate--protein ligase family protein [Chloroflexota bacterium]
MPYQSTAWRLVHTPPASGAWNMAVDEAILQHVGQGSVSPTLRLYAWTPPCLSIGYAQPIGDIDQQRLQAQGWDVVRRPTGGRALLHADELTYAVMAPKDEPRLAGSILEGYRRLSAPLLEALRRLGLDPKAHPYPTSNNSPSPLCFQTPSEYEITVNGKKVIGSAQARKLNGILQHGAIPLHGDITRITQCLTFPEEKSRIRAADHLLSRATTLTELLGVTLSWEAAAEALQIAFSQTLNLTFIPDDLTPSERTTALSLQNEKYARPDWTERI